MRMLNASRFVLKSISTQLLGTNEPKCGYESTWVRSDRFLLCFQFFPNQTEPKQLKSNWFNSISNLCTFLYTHICSAPIYITRFTSSLRKSSCYELHWKSRKFESMSVNICPWSWINCQNITGLLRRSRIALNVSWNFRQFKRRAGHRRQRVQQFCEARIVQRFHSLNRLGSTGNGTFGAAVNLRKLKEPFIVV